jgi:hypothetical protein
VLFHFRGTNPSRPCPCTAVLFLPFSQIGGGDPGRVLHESNDRKVAVLNALHLQPGHTGGRALDLTDERDVETE